MSDEKSKSFSATSTVVEPNLTESTFYDNELRKAIENFLKETLQGKDDQKATAFYDKIAEIFNFKKEKLIFVVVAHMTHTLPYFMEGLSKLGIVLAIIPKNSPCVEKIVASIQRSYNSFMQHLLNKKVLIGDKDNEKTKVFIKTALDINPNHRLMIIDHGGYFAPHLQSLLNEHGNKIAGIVEHTLNGEMKYRQALKALFVGSTQYFPPIFSIATRDLKADEDKHVAQSIVDTLRSKIFSGSGISQELSRLNVGIIGYGHMGKAVALCLQPRHEKGYSIGIYDISEEASKNASLKGFDVYQNKKELIQNSDVIITATSSIALAAEDFETMKTGTCIICVTSSDDQFSVDARKDLEKLNTHKNGDITSYRYKNAKILHFAADGKSVNFLIGSTSHPILHAVFASVCISAQICSTTPIAKRDIETCSNEYLETVKVIYDSFYLSPPPNSNNSTTFPPPSQIKQTSSERAGYLSNNSSHQDLQKYDKKDKQEGKDKNSKHAQHPVFPQQTQTPFWQTDNSSENYHPGQTSLSSNPNWMFSPIDNNRCYEARGFKYSAQQEVGVRMASVIGLVASMTPIQPLNEEVIDFLIQSLRDSEITIRNLVIKTFPNFKEYHLDPKVIKAFQIALDDPWPANRQEAIQIFLGFESPLHPEVITELLKIASNDPNEGVKGLAKSLLNRQQSISSINSKGYS